MPRYVQVGLILAGLGVAFTGALYAWNYFGIRSGFGGSIVTYIQIEITLGIIEELCTELGLFFIFVGILRLLPGAPPWSRIGPIFILIGAVVAVGINVAEAAFTSSNFGPSPVQLPEWTAYLLLVTLVAAYVVTTLGLLLSLFAVAKGVVLRGFTRPQVPQP